MNICFKEKASENAFYSGTGNIIYPRLDSNCILSICYDNKSDTQTIELNILPSQLWKDKNGNITIGETEESLKKDSTRIWTDGKTVL